MARKSLKLMLNDFVWAAKNIRGNEKMLLLYLVYRANQKTRQCNPSWLTIAKDTGMSRSTVARSLTKLEDKGYIKRANAKRTTQFSLLFWVSKRDPYSVKMRPQFYDMGPDEMHCKEDDERAMDYLNTDSNESR